MREPSTTSGQAPEKQYPRRWNTVLTLAWLAGGLLLSTPFYLLFRLGTANFANNLLLGCAAALVGILLIAVLCKIGRRTCLILTREQGYLLRRRIRQALGAGSVILVLMMATDFLPWPKNFLTNDQWRPIHIVGCSIGAICVLVWPLIALIIADPRQPGIPLVKTVASIPERAKRASRRLWTFNSVYWIGLLCLVVGFNIYLCVDMPGTTPIETISMCAGRIATQGLLIFGFILCCQVLRNLAPPLFSWFFVLVAAVVPIFAVADFILYRIWHQHLVPVLNLATVNGEINFEKEMKAADLQVTSLDAIGMAIIILGSGILLYLLTSLLSKKVGVRLTTRIAVLIIFGCWIVVLIEQALSPLTKRKHIWQKEHKTFVAHVGVFGPEIGLETIRMDFVDKNDIELQNELVANPPRIERKPDIFVFMVETFRSDAIHPGVAPNLSKFRDLECQKFDVTFAGANCTPLSWFSMFHSRVAMNWIQALAEGGEERNFIGAYPLRMLDSIGYNIECRAICDLTYKDLGPLNFGGDQRLADHSWDDRSLVTLIDQVKDPVRKKKLESLGMAEREMLITDQLRKSVLEKSAGGNFYYMAYDSPHYNYYWPKNHPRFTPLYGEDEYDQEMNFSLSPSGEDIRLVKQRYWNAVNWVDYQIEEFLQFLKDNDRYDNAIVIVTGDHGEEFHEHKSWWHCSGLNRYQTEVPIMIKWPAWMDKETIPQQGIASHLDVMPSILDALGFDEKYFNFLAGHSLLDPDKPQSAIICNWDGGTKDIGFCFVKDGLKANFSYKRGPAETFDIPEFISLENFSTLDDEPIEDRNSKGENDESYVYTKDLEAEFPSLIQKLFTSFEKKK